jgi:hypothetical protein
MGIPQMLIKMYVLLHLLLSKLHPVSRLVVILPIHIMDVNNSIWSCQANLEMSCSYQSRNVLFSGLRF